MPVLDEGHVLARSLTFDERLEGLRSGRATVATTDDAAQAVVARRLELLGRRLTLSSGRTMLMARLNRGKIPFSLAAAACSPDLQCDVPEPEWLRWFVLGAENLADGRISSADSSVAFDELLGAFEASALTRISGIDQMGHWRGSSASARQSALAWLRRRLSGVLQWCFYDVFDRFRQETKDESGTYGRFLAAAASPAWVVAFFTRYAGTARLLATIIGDWGDNLLLLLTRFHMDREAIAHYVDSGHEVAIDCFERFPSDPHAGGQSVAIIRLSTGQRIVYKPTDQTLAAFWSCATELWRSCCSRG